MKLAAFFRRVFQSALVLDIYHFWLSPPVRRKKIYGGCFMKRTFAFIAILVFLCAGTMLFAAGQKDDSAGGEVVITIPHYKAGQNVGGKFFLPQVERFNKKNEGVYKLVIEEIPQDSYMGKIKQLAQQNKLPALIEGMDEKWFFDVIAKNEMSLDLSSLCH